MTTNELLENMVEEKSQQWTRDARRTEPDYQVAAQRLANVHTVRLLHAAMGMATEAAEFLDMLKKHVFYGKPIDTVNAVEEIGDSTWYERIGADELAVTYCEVIRRNIAKLKKRFPDKFSEKDAVNRNLVAERQILEGDKAA